MIISIDSEKQFVIQSGCPAMDECIKKPQYKYTMEYYSSIKKNESWAPVVHACNPSYSRGKDQEDHGWKPALGK
jgi:hypothetical protein